MVDAAIVMIENAHKRLEEWEHQHPGEAQQRHTLENTEASVEVGPALFISLLIITLSFIPIFTLEGRGQLFGPLAFTKPGRWPGRRCWRSWRSRSDGLLDPRQDPGGEQQSAESL